MNGAEALVRTLVDSGVRTCFTNPGTSEMYAVAALDAVPGMRGVLCLFEGVATGAADGYGRIADRPAMTLLHLGPGLGNGLANLHNARRAHTPVVNVVGDHATYHKKYDAPLESDIDALAGAVSGWVRRPADPAQVGADAAAAVAAARTAPGAVSTLILPADVSWSDGGVPAAPVAGHPAAQVPAARVSDIAGVLASGEPVVVLLGGRACREDGLRAASRVAAATGARVLVETFPARMERGADLPAFDRLAYFPDQAVAQLAGAAHVVLAGARSPVSFFAYPGKPSDLVPPAAAVHTLAEPAEDATAALAELADLVAGGVEPVLAPAARPGLPAPNGSLDIASWVDVVAALLPEGAIVVDEANTSGALLPAATAGSPRHDLLSLTGGAIGIGLPLATGAAVAAPDRPVVDLQADGSAMYTISALWTQAREGLNVTTVILHNAAYAILRFELAQAGAAGAPGGGAGAAGQQARQLLDLSQPDLDFVRIAEGFGVPATRARTNDELANQFARALAEPGPHLIDAIVPSAF